MKIILDYNSKQVLNAPTVTSEDYLREYEVNKHELVVNNQFYKIAFPPFRDHPPYPEIGDRVITITNDNKHINFGKRGTVIGIYDELIEILFDDKFIGGTGLNGRCENFRGGILTFHEIFDLTSWPSWISLKKKYYTNDNTWSGQIDRKMLLGKLNHYQNKIKEMNGYVENHHQNKFDAYQGKAGRTNQAYNKEGRSDYGRKPQYDNNRFEPLGGKNNRGGHRGGNRGGDGRQGGNRGGQDDRGQEKVQIRQPERRGDYERRHFTVLENEGADDYDYIPKQPENSKQQPQIGQKPQPQFNFDQDAEMLQNMISQGPPRGGQKSGRGGRGQNHGNNEFNFEHKAKMLQNMVNQQGGQGGQGRGQNNFNFDQNSQMLQNMLSGHAMGESGQPDAKLEKLVQDCFGTGQGKAKGGQSVEDQLQMLQGMVGKDRQIGALEQTGMTHEQVENKQQAQDLMGQLMAMNIGGGEGKKSRNQNQNQAQGGNSGQKRYDASNMDQFMNQDQFRGGKRHNNQQQQQGNQQQQQGNQGQNQDYDQDYNQDYDQGQYHQQETQRGGYGGQRGQRGGQDSFDNRRGGQNNYDNRRGGQNNYDNRRGGQGNHGGHGQGQDRNQGRNNQNQDRNNQNQGYSNQMNQGYNDQNNRRGGYRETRGQSNYGGGDGYQNYGNDNRGYGNNDQ
jgi:hypothetical protein